MLPFCLTRSERQYKLAFNQKGNISSHLNGENIVSENQQDKKSKAPFASGIRKGIAIGVAMGAGIGAALDNLAIGIGVGVALGVALGKLAFSPRSENENSRDN